MKLRKILALVLSLVMVFSLCSTAMAAHLTNEVTELEQNNSDLSMELAMEAYVLFENNGVLPLKGEKAVALFGNGTEYTCFAVRSQDSRICKTCHHTCFKL